MLDGGAGAQDKHCLCTAYKERWDDPATRTLFRFCLLPFPCIWCPASPYCTLMPLEFLLHLFLMVPYHTIPQTSPTPCPAAPWEGCMSSPFGVEWGHETSLAGDLGPCCAFFRGRSIPYGFPALQTRVLEKGRYLVP